MKRPRWRKMTWVLIVWCVLILAWAIGGGAANNCGEEADELSRSACEAGTGIGVAIILFIGFVGFVFFALIWFMTRPKTRDCPRCGNDVKKGVTVCSSCGFDFATLGQPQSATPMPASTAGPERPQQ